MTVTTARSASGVSRTDDRSYRTYLTFDAHPDALPLALQQIAGWLRGKGYGDDLDLTTSGFTQINPAAEIVVVHHQGNHLHSFRIRLTETDPSGQWVTTLALASPDRGTGWLSIRVSHSGGKIAARPKVARHLIEVLHLRDSGYQAIAGAPVIRPDGVDDLLDAVCDPDRSGLLFVAGTDLSDPGLFTPFAARVTKWADGIHGMAQAVVLDPAATDAFNQAIGDTHGVPPWTIRTYLPGADPAWEPDARWHRILGTRRLARDSDRVIRRILDDAARRHASTRELPAATQSVLRNLNRIEDRLLLDPLLDGDPTPMPAAEPGETPTVTDPDTAPAPAEPGTEGTEPPAPTEPTDQPTEPGTEGTEPPAPSGPTDDEDTAPTEPSVADEAAAYLTLHDLLHRTLGIDDPTEANIRTALDQVRADAAAAARDQAARDHAHRDAQRHQTTSRVSRELADRQHQIEDLEDALAEARAAADEATIEQAIAERDRLRAEDEARWLRDVLTTEGRYDDAHAALPANRLTAIPETFDDLVDRLDDLADLGVVFTGDKRITLALTDRDTLGSIAQVAWECLLVLADYAKAKQTGDHTGNLKQYILHTPQGYRPISKNRFGEKESTSTLNQWGSDRVFPVPDGVTKDGSSQVLMEAHFKLPRCGIVTPRMHFYDHTHATGNIYVGYIGPHLRTKDTN